MTDIERVLDLAIALGDLARKVRRERRTEYRKDGVIATWEPAIIKTGPAATVKVILDDTSPAGAWDA